MAQPILFNITHISHRIYLAGLAANTIAADFLKQNPRSPNLMGSPNAEAIQAMKISLKLMETFSGENDHPDQEKQETYLQFIALMDHLSKSPGTFAKELQKHGLMDKICRGLGVLFYKEKETGTEIQNHLPVHLAILQNTWFPPKPQLDHHPKP